MIRNGLSCVSCRTEGIKPLKDEVRPMIRRVGKLDAWEAQFGRVVAEFRVELSFRQFTQFGRIKAAAF